VNVNGTIEIRLLVSRGPKTFKLAMAAHALSGNTSLIATFSSYTQVMCTTDSQLWFDLFFKVIMVKM